MGETFAKDCEPVKQKIAMCAQKVAKTPRLGVKKPARGGPNLLLGRVRNVLLARFAKDCDTVSMQDDLDTQIRAELDRRRGDWQKIAVAAEVSHSWISQFVREKIPNPGYATLKRLRQALALEATAPLAQVAANAMDAPEALHGEG